MKISTQEAKEVTIAPRRSTNEENRILPAPRYTLAGTEPEMP
jgi:hypothetical protein